jgi:predicted metalloprotease with PDZ domain
MKYLFLIQFVCCCIAGNAQVAEGTAIDARLEYKKVNRKVEVTITLAYKVLSNEPMQIGNLRDFFGTPSLGRFITALSGTNGTTVTKRGGRDSLYITPSNQQVNFNYTLVYDSTILSNTTYAPNVGEDHVHFVFCQWMLPIAPAETVLDYSIHIDQLPDHWILYSSQANEERNFSFTNSMNNAYRWAMGAGSFYKRSFTEQGGAVLNIYIKGNYVVGNDRLVDLVHKTVTYQHALFNDFNFKFYSVPILAKEENIAGISIPNMFLCHVREDVPYERLAWLMSHEMGHRWVGNRLFIKDTTASFGLRHQWFKEGIDDYLAFVAVLDSKLFSKDVFIKELNNYIRNIKENPYSTASEDSMRVIASTGRFGVEATKIAYYKGMLMGFVADKDFFKISSTGLQSRVRDFVQSLLKNERYREIDEQIFFQIADSMQLPLHDLYMKHIINGSADFDLPKFVFGNEYELKKTSYPVYDLGLSLVRKDGKTYVASINTEGPAYKAGIRENMELVSSTSTNRFSNSWFDDLPVKMVMLVDGRQKTFEYLPKGKTVSVDQYIKR